MSDTPIPFEQARHYKPAGRTSIDLVVIHSAEVGETLDAAEALMRACAKSERVASWHFAIDADSVTQSVREADIAFHAPGANRNSIGIELCGRARQTVEEWEDSYSRTMLSRAAELVAGICARWNIPVVAVAPAGLLAGVRGITSHAAVSEAWGKSSHTDPGPNFPFARFLALVGTYQRLRA